MLPNASPNSIALSYSQSPSSSSSLSLGAANAEAVLLRTSCEICRNRKLKCDGVPPSLGGCSRCKKDGVACQYRIRAPIGRPKGTTKAKMDDKKGVPPKARKDDPRKYKRQRSHASSRDDSVDSAYSPRETEDDRSVAATPPSRNYHGSQPSPLVAAAAAAAADVAAFSRRSPTAGRAPSQGASSDGTRTAAFPHTTPGSALPGYESHPSHRVTSDWDLHELRQQADVADPPQSLPTPQSISPTAPLPFDNHSSLASLEMAAYLDSLNRVEIKPSDGLTPTMLLAPMPASSSSRVSHPASDMANAHSTPAEPFLNTHDSMARGATPSTSSQFLDLAPTDPWAGSFLDEAVSYAVPSDLSWWNVGLDPNEPGPVLPSAVAEMAMPAAQEGTLLPGVDAPHPPHDTAHSHGLDAQDAAHFDWPRGAQNGMGSGTLRTENGVVLSGGPWPEQKSAPRAAMASRSDPSYRPGPNGPSGADTFHPHHWANGPDADRDVKTGLEAVNSTGVEANGLEAQRCARTGAEKCCCAGQGMPGGMENSIHAKTQRSRPPSSAASTSPPCSTGEAAGSDASSPRVHCVPNPSGTGCTCMCETDVCLLRVKRTMNGGKSFKSAAEIAQDLQEGAAIYDGSGTAGELSLHLTLSASQAVSASCACSSSCPTCRSDASSSSYNASLLISLALQIYARAVRILRDGFGGGGSGSGSASGSVATSLEVKIGGYKPSKKNARKIALLAMRLELTDLEKAMGRVWLVAAGEDGDGGEAAGTKVNGNGHGPKGHPSSVGHVEKAKAHRIPAPDRRLAPLDRIIICKLREQLREMISRVEGLEKA